MNDFVKKKEIIKRILGERSLLEQLSEESSELSKASLKCVRALGLSPNITPISSVEAIDNLKEEFNDVLLVADLLGLTKDEKFIDFKLERWNDRLLKSIINDTETFFKLCGKDTIESILSEYQCEKCGKLLKVDYKFCPYCGGAKNKEGQ